MKTTTKLRLEPRIPRSRQVELGLCDEDLCFRNDLNLQSPRLDEFLAEIERRLLKEDRTTKRGKIEQKKYDRRLCCLLANAIQAYGSRDSVHYSRRHDDFNGKETGRPSWLSSRGVGPLVDRMDQNSAGLLCSIKGFRTSEAVSESTFAATDLLLEIAREYGIGLGSVISAKRERCVLTVKNEDGTFVEFNPSKQPYKKLVAEIDTINRSYETRVITIVIDGVSEEVSSKNLRQVFNSSSLLKGGRMYGPMYQRRCEEDRSTMRIDGSPTSESDLGGCFPRLLYHRAGLSYNGDPYLIEEACRYLEQFNLPNNDPRNVIKFAFQLIVNNKSQKSAVRALLKGKYQKDKDKKKQPQKVIRYNEFMSYGQAKELFIIIESYHDLIADQFYKYAGVELMKIESDICKEVILEGIKVNKCVLSIYDSFVVKLEDKEWLEDMIRYMYYLKLGFFPVIK